MPFHPWFSGLAFPFGPRLSVPTPPADVTGWVDAALGFVQQLTANAVNLVDIENAIVGFKK